MGLVLVFLGIERSPDASAAITVRNTAELAAAVEQLRTSSGTIVLRPQRYSAVVVGPRAPRWLTIIAQPGASAARISLQGTQFVKLVGLRLNPRSGGAHLEVRSSSAVRLERLTVVGQGLLPANASVLQSGGVVITEQHVHPVR